ncbi:hypothetical protein ACFXQA_07465 [Microbacterium sp. P07]|uniref:hypothetical protein n=1 Tax=Microbacterium sp. P07 TaxID=3366952 RepID=UPI0037460825
MIWPGVPTVPVTRRRDEEFPLDNRKLRRAIDQGAWVRVAPGAFVESADWRSLRPIQRHRLRVKEVADRARAPQVYSHFAAAAALDIDVLGAWPDPVDVTIDRATGGRSGGAIRRHALGLDGIDTIVWNGHLITSPAQTALDLARCLPFTQAVAVIDQAVWVRRRGGPLTTTEELRRLLELSTRRGTGRALRAIAASRPLADNVRETESRLLIVRLGFPSPRLQERRILASGRVVFGDFFFPDANHWGELDGRGKYLSPESDADRSTADIVIDEKNRENEIRRTVRGFSRWEPSDIAPRRLYDILTADGLRSSRPRP